MLKRTRLAVQSTLIGYGISIGFTGALLALGLSPLGRVLPLSLDAPLAVLGHVLAFGAVFSVVQFLLRHLSQDGPDQGPRGGHRLRELKPIRVPVTAEKGKRPPRR